MNYLVCAIKSWNIKVFNEIISKYEGAWSLITEDLTLEKVKEIDPKYIFFPHWSKRVPEEIINSYECIGFHETPLPYGRGGSPIQNMIIRGHKETILTAFRVTKDFDAGDIYLQRHLSLDGLAEEIYIRISKIIAAMIECIVDGDYSQPKKQVGAVVHFIRRNPTESEIPKNLTKEELFDFIRMLDAEGYPKAFIDFGKFRLEFTRPALKTNGIICDVVINEK